MKIKSNCLIIFVLAAIVDTQCASEIMSLDALIKKAYVNNPEINSARKKSDAMNTVSSQMKTPENPQFFVDYQKMPSGSFSPGSAEEKMFGITQMLPWPGKLKIDARIAGQDAGIAELEEKNTEIGVISKLKAAYAEYFYINKEIEIYAENAAIMGNMSKSLESRYAAGSASQADVLNAQVEASKMSNMLLNLKEEVELSRAMINMLVGGNPDENIGAPENIQIEYISNDWDSIKRIVLKNNYDIKKQNLKIIKSKLQKNYGARGFFPDFELTFRKRRMGNMWAGNDFMLGFTTPLWFWKPALNVKQMSYELEMAEYDSKSAEIAVIYNARIYFTRIETSRNLIELYKTGIIPQAEQSKKAAETEYFSGKGDFLQFLDSARTLLSFKIDYYKNVMEYYQNLAMLEQIAGIELPTGGKK